MRCIVALVLTWTEPVILKAEWSEQKLPAANIYHDFLVSLLEIKRLMNHDRSIAQGDITIFYPERVEQGYYLMRAGHTEHVLLDDGTMEASVLSLQL